MSVNGHPLSYFVFNGYLLPGNIQIIFDSRRPDTDKSGPVIRELLEAAGHRFGSTVHVINPALIVRGDYTLRNRFQCVLRLPLAATE